MPITRRRFLGLATTFPWLAACDLGASSLSRKLKGLPMQPISAEEIELLRNPLARPAWFARHNLPQDQPLEVRQRLIGEARGLLRGADIKDVRFVNCSFEGFQGLDNNLENVQFEECQFLGGALTGDYWKNVIFRRCEAEGPFKIGCADGDIAFENCKLRGMTAEEGGYGNWSDHFGIASASEGSIRFQSCHIENIGGRGAKEYALIDCEIGDLIGGGEDRQGTILIENCRCISEKNKHDFQGSSGFSRITIRNSKLGQVDLMSATADEFEIVGSSMSLEIGAVDGRFGKAEFRNTRFFGKGLYCPLIPQIGSFLIENCAFDSSEFNLFGEPNKRPPTSERGPIYWTRIRELTLRDQPLSKANMAYVQVGTFAIENSTLSDCNLSNGRFGTWRFVNAKLSGALNLSGTTIRHIENQGLAQNASIIGKLEASSDAPEPDVQHIGRLPGDKKSK